jgi:hypothetical protein
MERKSGVSAHRLPGPVSVGNSPEEVKRYLIGKGSKWQMYYSVIRFRIKARNLKSRPFCN